MRFKGAPASQGRTEVDTPQGEAENPPYERRSGEIGRRAGFKIRSTGDVETAAKPADKAVSEKNHAKTEMVLARHLRQDPDLAELVSVWKLLPEATRAAVLAIVRAKPV
jgi:hypothetical protein